MASKEKNITVNLKIWRQKNRKDTGRFEDYTLEGVSTGSSFLEMLDQLNEKLVRDDKEPTTNISYHQIF